MPTLSQWKILKNLMIARRRAAAEVEEASQETEENAEPRDVTPDENVDIARSPSIQAVSPNKANSSDDNEDKDNGNYPRGLSSCPDLESDDQTSDVNKVGLKSCNKPISDPNGFGESSSSTKDAVRNNSQRVENNDIGIDSSPRVRSAKQRPSSDIANAPKEISNTGEDHQPLRSTTPNSSHGKQISDRLSPDPRDRSTDNLDDGNTNHGGLMAQESFAASDTRSSFGNIPELLDPEKLRVQRRRASIQSARSSRTRVLSPSPQPVDAKASKSVKFSGHANVALFHEDEEPESDDEDKLRINFEDVKQNLYDKFSSRPRPRSCNLSDRDSRRSMESLITVSSFQPFENSSVFSFPAPGNAGRFKKTAQLMRSKTSPYLFNKHLTDDRSSAESNLAGKGQGQGENTSSERWRLKRLGTSNNMHVESSVVRTGCVEATQTDQRVSSSTGITNNNFYLRERILKRTCSRLSLPGSDVTTDHIEGANENNLIIRGGPQLNHSIDASSIEKKPLNRTSSVRNGIFEVSRWSMATQSIVTEQCASPVNGSRPSSGILQPRQQTVINDTEMPEEVQNNLQKLGFRKRDKSKKKKSDKSGKKSSQKKNAAKTDAQRVAIDLKRDPMLLKVQKKNRNVGKFICAPELMPNAICFEMAGTSLSHSDVIQLLKPLTDKFPEVKIRTIQFSYRSLLNNTPDMDNRWIINTNSVMSRNRLAGSELTIHGQVHQLRRYDDVITSEYQQYMRMMEFVKMMNSRKILG